MNYLYEVKKASFILQPVSKPGTFPLSNAAACWKHEVSTCKEPSTGPTPESQSRTSRQRSEEGII